MGVGSKFNEDWIRQVVGVACSRAEIEDLNFEGLEITLENLLWMANYYAGVVLVHSEV